MPLVATPSSALHHQKGKQGRHTFMLYRCQSDAKCCLCSAGSLNATAHEMHVNTWEASKSAILLSCCVD